MGANLLSLLRDSIQVVCRLQFGLCSLIIYPRDERDKLMSQEDSQEGCEGVQEAVESRAAAGLESLQLSSVALAGAHSALNLSSLDSSVCLMG